MASATERAPRPGARSRVPATRDSSNGKCRASVTSARVKGDLGLLSNGPPEPAASPGPLDHGLAGVTVRAPATGTRRPQRRASGLDSDRRAPGPRRGVRVLLAAGGGVLASPSACRYAARL